MLTCEICPNLIKEGSPYKKTCSIECNKIRLKKYKQDYSKTPKQKQKQSIRMKEYYKTSKWKRYKKKYQEENKERIKAYTKEYNKRTEVKQRRRELRIKQSKSIANIKIENQKLKEQLRVLRKQVKPRV